MEALFWIAVAGVLYPYVGYPLALALLGRVIGRCPNVRKGAPLPSVTMIVPANNEEARIGRKVGNTAALDYPRQLLDVVFVSDGSTDRTADVIRSAAGPGVRVIELPERGGKAAALNAALRECDGEIVVFSDASIELEPDALVRIVQPFQDPAIGCVSGEDRIAESGGEALYGRYELMLRRLESSVHSIVGASGSFYAQRRALCAPFTEGMAPDFLSVLRTVEQEFRAVSEPTAVGSMTSVKDPRQEYDRKVRTLIRGMTALFAFPHLLNPWRHGWFAFALWSHKIMRWAAPLFLLVALVTPLGLLHSPFYATAWIVQLVFYAVAVAAYAEWGPLHRSLVGKIALYFSTVNGAVLTAWCKYGLGVRQELWTPSRR